MASLFDWCGREQASFCQAGPGRLADLLQALQEGRGYLIILCRARIGHTHLTHSEYRMKKDPPPQCEHGQCILTIRHILLKKENICLVEEMSWNHLDSTQH